MYSQNRYRIFHQSSCYQENTKQDKKDKEFIKEFEYHWQKFSWSDKKITFLSNFSFFLLLYLLSFVNFVIRLLRSFLQFLQFNQRSLSQEWNGHNVVQDSIFVPRRGILCSHLFPRGSPRISWINKYFALVSNIQFFLCGRKKIFIAKRAVFFFFFYKSDENKSLFFWIFVHHFLFLIFFILHSVFSTSYINVITALNPLRERCYFSVKFRLKIRFRLI